MSRAPRGPRPVYEDDHRPSAFEKLRANVPLWRTLGTMASVMISALWITWQGSQWVTRLETRLAAIETIAAKKADATDLASAVRDFEHKFALMCARAPAAQKVWVCGSKG